MNHKWKRLPQDPRWAVKDYQCLNCKWFKIVPSKGTTYYSQVAINSGLINEIKSCGEIMMEEILE